MSVINFIGSIFHKSVVDKKAQLISKKKIVAVDTKYRGHDGFMLIHIYEIISEEGSMGIFKGNIKILSKHLIYKASNVKHKIENVPVYRDLTNEEKNAMNKSDI